MKPELRSLAEIRATVTKAARGAGCPWGMAEDAGQAAYQLSAHGLPGAAAVAALLRTPRACACSGGDSADLPACGLRAMVALMDDPAQTDVVLGPVAGPLLVAAAFLHAGSDHWRIDAGGGGLHCGPNGIVGNQDFAFGDIAEVALARSAPAETARGPSWASQPVDPQDWQALEAYAARTYVPETAASRASGAGPSD